MQHMLLCLLKVLVILVANENLYKGFIKKVAEYKEGLGVNKEERM